MMSWKKARVLGLLALSVIGAGWLGDSAAALFSAIPELCASRLAFGEFGLALLWFLVSFCLFCSTLVLLYRHRSDVIHTSARALPATGYAGHAALIMALSNLRPDQTQLAEGLRSLGIACFRKPAAADPPLLERLPWMQNLRLLCDSLSGRKETLRYVVIIASPESDPQVDLFESIARDALKGLGIESVVFERQEGVAPDANDFDALLLHVERAHTRCLRNMGGRRGRVCIDITSGTKIYTGAATSFAVTRGIPFSYVDNIGRVHYAMARVELPHLLEP